MSNSYAKMSKNSLRVYDIRSRFMTRFILHLGKFSNLNYLHCIVAFGTTGPLYSKSFPLTLKKRIRAENSYLLLSRLLIFFSIPLKDPFTAKNDSQVFYCRSLALAYIEVIYQVLTFYCLKRKTFLKSSY